MSHAANQIKAEEVLEPAQVAEVLFRALFERGPNRLSSAAKFVAIGTMTGGLIEWKKNLLKANEGEGEKWKKMYQEVKTQLDEVRLRLAILEKEK